MGIRRKKITVTWCITDVKQLRPDLSDQECAEVLGEVLASYDARLGINWDGIEHIANILFPEV